MPRDRFKGLTALLAAAAVPLAVCLLLLPVRGALSHTNVALILMLVVAAVAALGHRWAAVLTALSAAVSFVGTGGPGTQRAVRSRPVMWAVHTRARVQAGSRGTLSIRRRV